MMDDVRPLERPQSEPPQKFISAGHACGGRCGMDSGRILIFSGVSVKNSRLSDLFAGSSWVVVVPQQ